jgi:hypothetical protein
MPLMARCDLCDANVPASDLEQLRPQYQAEGVVDVCGKCSAWASKRKGAMLDEITTKLRDEIAAKRRMLDIESIGLGRQSTLKRIGAWLGW